MYIKCSIFILLCLPIIRGQEVEEEGEEDGFQVEKTETHHFAIDCPGHYFRCSNGECISPKWRCDNHYDCDDYSDELNCTYKAPMLTNVKFDHLHHTSPDLKQNHPVDDVSKLKFNSTIEPMMLFSTGLSIRGFWMHSRIYFDIVSLLKRHAITETPSISQAFSILFGLTQKSPQARVEEVTIKTTSTIVGIDMDPNNKEVYWVELGKEPGVYSMLINENEFDDSRIRREANVQKTIVDTGLISPEDIALDIVGRNIYITDAGLPAIIVCSVKYKYCKHLVEHNLQKPRAIIVDPSTGWLTYTDWGDDPGIFVVSMDGKRREVLVNEDIVWPNGLAADYTADHLFWADARLKRIERIDLKTRLRRVIVREEAGNPFSLSLFENNIYWSDWAGSDIKTCDKFYGNDTKTILHADNIYGIHIYHPSIKASGKADPCWSKQCSHLCLLAPVPHSFSFRKQGAITASCMIPLIVSNTLNINNHNVTNTSTSTPTPIATPTATPTSAATAKIINNSNIENSTPILWLILLITSISIIGMVALSYIYLRNREIPSDRVNLM